MEEKQEPTCRGDAANDGSDQSLPAGPTQSFSCLNIRQKANRKHLLVSESAVKSENTHTHTHL